MTKRTLRYDHDKTCPGAPLERETLPVKRRTKPIRQEPQTQAEGTQKPNDLIELEKAITKHSSGKSSAKNKS